jgi:hypothetical protein
MSTRHKMLQKLLIVYFIFDYLMTLSTVDAKLPINKHLSHVVYLGKTFDKSELRA